MRQVTKRGSGPKVHIIGWSDSLPVDDPSSPGLKDADLRDATSPSLVLNLGDFAIDCNVARLRDIKTLGSVEAIIVYDCSLTSVESVRTGLRHMTKVFTIRAPSLSTFDLLKALMPCYERLDNSFSALNVLHISDFYFHGLPTGRPKPSS